MKDDAVIEPALHQRLDLRDMLWRPVGTEPDDDLAVFGRQDDGIVRFRSRPGGRSGKKRKRQRGAAAEKEHAGPRIAAAAAGSPARRDSRLKAHCNLMSGRRPSATICLRLATVQGQRTPNFAAFAK